jgi:hypothetical protein
VQLECTCGKDKASMNDKIHPTPLAPVSAQAGLARPLPRRRRRFRVIEFVGSE